MTYKEYIACKMSHSLPTPVDHGEIAEHLFPFQRELVKRALAAGRYALFTDTGTGKTAMQVEWARHVSAHGRVLILAPLAVANQTVAEAKKFGVDAAYMRGDDKTTKIAVTNYEMLERFNADDFIGIVLDESSILKSYTGRTRNAIIEAFSQTQYRLAATATPSPNDHTELGNHSEFLGYKTRTEMLAEYFVHDGGSTQNWRLKGHAKDIFWGWVLSWAAIMSKPSDLGYADDGFDLPALKTHEHVIALDQGIARSAGFLFIPQVTSLNEQRAIRRSTISERVSKANLIARECDSCIVWCELNDESDEASKLIDGAVNLQGSDSLEDKERKLLGFSSGEIRVLITKPSIAGFGMNWQHCSNMVFVGPSHSFEQTYQAIRRCWRFGQEREVNVHFIRTDADGEIVKNFQRKESSHREMMSAMAKEAESVGRKRWNSHNTTKVEAPKWLTQ